MQPRKDIGYGRKRKRKITQVVFLVSINLNYLGYIIVVTMHPSEKWEKSHVIV